LHEDAWRYFGVACRYVVLGNRKGTVKPASGLNILLMAEYARSTQAFAVESVEHGCAAGLSLLSFARHRVGKCGAAQQRYFRCVATGIRRV
jgi:hypothetical protein